MGVLWRMNYKELSLFLASKGLSETGQKSITGEIFTVLIEGPRGLKKGGVLSETGQKRITGRYLPLLIKGVLGGCCLRLDKKV